MNSDARVADGRIDRPARTLIRWRLGRSQLALAVTALLALVGGAASTLVANAEWLPVVAVLAPLVVLGVLLRRRLASPILSPVWIVVTIIAVVGFSGYLLQAALNGRSGGGLSLSLTPPLELRTAYLFAKTETCIVIGAALFCFLLRRKLPSGTQRVRDRRIAHRQRPKVERLIAASYIPAVVIILSSGTALWVRPSHLIPSNGSSIAGAASLLSIVAVAVSGYAWARTSGAQRVLVLLLVAAYVVLFFALSSRKLAIIPMCFLIGHAVGSRRASWRMTVLALIATVALFPIPLYLRDLSIHGLEPYILAMPSFSYGTLDLGSTVNNVLIAFPIAGVVAFATPQLPVHYFTVEMNPLPGNLAGWYNITPHLRLNNWTPYSAVGELGNHGGLIFIGFWIGLGVLLAYFDHRVKVWREQGFSLMAAAISGGCMLFAVSGLQYNLRSVVRLLIYIVVLEVVVRAVLSLRRTARSPRTLTLPISAAAPRASAERSA